jgi:aspartyl-tRNA(Asn)/glutamyl-tRNA(Gln) amidotransferase subunit B
MKNKFTSDIVIGLEIHVQLDTNTKLFCGCKTKGDEEPNSRCCEICLGHPGTRPMLNKKVLDYAIKFCLAVESKLAPRLVFSRKSYFYPDMSKNFQITQFEEPLGIRGKIELKSGKIINLTRAHIEEDPASITYPGKMNSSAYSLIDYNRAGNPLIEIVTEPEMDSPDEARDFLNQLINVLTYLKIFDVNDCIIKADANISIKESNYSRVEIKNITGFKEIEKALNYEILRQKNSAAKGEKIKLETRGWDGKITYTMRTKETEADYGYIIEPDLSIINIDEEMVHRLRKEIPELSHLKAKRYVKDYKINPVDAEVMASQLELAELFEKVAEKIDAKLVAQWMRKELLRVLNYNNKKVSDLNFGVEEIVELLGLIDKKVINDVTASRMIEELMLNVFSPMKYVKENNLEQIRSGDELDKICKKVVKDNEKAVKDYKSGSEKSFNYLVGQVMKLTKGKADPNMVNKIIKSLI